MAYKTYNPRYQYPKSTVQDRFGGVDNRSMGANMEPSMVDYAENVADRWRGAMKNRYGYTKFDAKKFDVNGYGQAFDGYWAQSDGDVYYKVESVLDYTLRPGTVDPGVIFPTGPRYWSSTSSDDSLSTASSESSVSSSSSTIGQSTSSITESLSSSESSTSESSSSLSSSSVSVSYSSQSSGLGFSSASSLSDESSEGGDGGGGGGNIYITIIGGPTIIIDGGEFEFGGGIIPGGGGGDGELPEGWIRPGPEEGETYRWKHIVLAIKERYIAGGIALPSPLDETLYDSEVLYTDINAARADLEALIQPGRFINPDPSKTAWDKYHVFLLEKTGRDEWLNVDSAGLIAYRADMLNTDTNIPMMFAYLEATIKELKYVQGVTSALHLAGGGGIDDYEFYGASWPPNTIGFHYSMYGAKGKNATGASLITAHVSYRTSMVFPTHSVTASTTPLAKPHRCHIWCNINLTYAAHMNNIKAEFQYYLGGTFTVQYLDMTIGGVCPNVGWNKVYTSGYGGASSWEYDMLNNASYMSIPANPWIAYHCPVYGNVYSSNIEYIFTSDTYLGNPNND